MSINGIGGPPNRVNTVYLSQIREKHKAGETLWTNENTQVLKEAKDNYLPEEEREANLIKDYESNMEEKARIQEALEKAQHGDFQLLSALDFLSLDHGVATDENSTLMKDLAKIDNPRAHSNTPDVLLMEGDGNISETVLSTPSSEIKEKMDIKKANVQTATIGTFNIEWLGVKKRSDADYAKIAQIIQDSGSALMGIQEIGKVEGLEKVLEHLPNWGYILGKSGNQMVGMIFDKDRVSYNANSIEQLEEVTVGNPYLRPPLSVDMKVDNFDFNFIVIHTKAKFDDASVEVRNKQMKVLNKWVKDRLKNNPDKDVIIVGDFNDFVNSPALNNLTKGDVLEMATQTAPDKGVYSNIPFKSLIDHIAVSKGDGGAVEEMIPDSARTINEKDYPQYRETVSDHKPVFFDVRTDTDND